MWQLSQTKKFLLVTLVWVAEDLTHNFIVTELKSVACPVLTSRFKISWSTLLFYIKNNFIHMKHVLIVLSIHSWKRQCRANEWHMTLLKQIVINNYILDKHCFPISQFSRQGYSENSLTGTGYCQKVCTAQCAHM